ncbi:MAG: hypothetical protein Q4C12_02920 [Clostridia bacterium]|nr:hypothetical protein [Clostridia bacterium]
MFEPYNFVENLRYMGLGMLGIAVVMAVIIIITSVLNAVTSKKSDNNK